MIITAIKNLFNNLLLKRGKFHYIFISIDKLNNELVMQDILLFINIHCINVLLYIAFVLDLFFRTLLFVILDIIRYLPTLANYSLDQIDFFFKTILFYMLEMLPYFISGCKFLMYYLDLFFKPILLCMLDVLPYFIVFSKFCIYYFNQLPQLLTIFTLLVMILLLIIFLLFYKATSFVYIRKYTLYGTICFLIFSLLLLFQYSTWTYNFGQYQMVFVLNSEPILGIDGLSLCFIILTTFIFPVCILVIWEYSSKLKELCIALLSLEFFLILAFSSINLLLFYVSFEVCLIPMSYIIFRNGSRSRKIKATFYFFLYTLISSLFMLVGILILYYLLGSTNYFVLQTATILQTTIGLFLWPLFFLAFAVKIPMFPFHLWLPEAHVEAPTEGSIILAGLLLKLGGYGFLRILLSFFPFATMYFRPLVITFALLGIIYSSITLLRQIDMKRIIAYSSISHMNLSVLGFFSDTSDGILGSVYLLISHGFSSSALFFLVGILYSRFHTRLIYNYSGLSLLMPKFHFFFFFFTLANFGFPGTANFLAESVILMTLVELSFFIFFIAGFGIIFSVIYSLLLYSRLMLGRLNFFYIYNDIKCDLTKKEVIILTYFLIVLLLFGCQSSFVNELLTSHSVFICNVNT